MKKYLISHKNDLFRVAMWSIIALLAINAVCAFVPVAAFCDDLFTTAESSLGDFQKKLVSLSKAIFPVAMIITLILFATTHNEKKMGIYKTILITICCVTGLILLVDSGYILNFIKDLVNFADK